MKTKLFVALEILEDRTKFTAWTTRDKRHGRLEGAPHLALPQLAERFETDQPLSIKVQSMTGIKPDRDTLINLSNNCVSKGHSIAF